MKCPFCAHVESKVIDSRASAGGDVIRRRRECELCAKRFTSYERVEETFPLVIKKDGRRETFDRQKIFYGLKKACDKRAVPVERIEQAIDAIERSLIDSDRKEVSSIDIGERVMVQLRSLDEVAYVRFASVYRSFRDIAEFQNELERIAQDKKPASEPGAPSRE
jgi:transcriptional repressor NrdR